MIEKIATQKFTLIKSDGPFEEHLHHLRYKFHVPKFRYPWTGQLQQTREQWLFVLRWSFAEGCQLCNWGCCSRCCTCYVSVFGSKQGLAGSRLSAQNMHCLNTWFSSQSVSVAPGSIQAAPLLHILGATWVILGYINLPPRQTLFKGQNRYFLMMNFSSVWADHWLWKKSCCFSLFMTAYVR